MHENILSEKQKQLLPLISKFSERFGLVGGTAIALHIGHRRSIDYDLAILEPLNSEKVTSLIRETYPIEHTLIDEANELTVVTNSVKITFFTYPFKITFADQFAPFISMPDLLTLSSMKAYALGRRAKWKDYVDIYFIFQQGFSLTEVAARSRQIFGGEFNEKSFREQLSYFSDIDYTEQIDFMPGSETSDNVIKNTLTQISLQK